MSLAWHMKVLVSEKVANGERYPYKFVTVVESGETKTMGAATTLCESEFPEDRVVDSKEIRGTVLKRKNGKG